MDNKHLINTLKIFNNFQNSSMEIALHKNLSFGILHTQPYEDYNLNHYFFSKLGGDFYRVSRNEKHNIRAFQEIGSGRIIPKSYHPYTFDKRATGIMVGSRFWLLGGSSNFLDPKFGTSYNGHSGLGMITQKKSFIWNIQKSKWIQGPTLPENIFLYYASASAVNSSHVIFIGANALYHESEYLVVHEQATQNSKTRQI